MKEYMPLLFIGLVAYLVLNNAQKLSQETKKVNGITFYKAKDGLWHKLNIQN